MPTGATFSIPVTARPTAPASSTGRAAPPAPRRNLLDHLLARYHHTILRCGVTDYAWDQLWEDFRLAAARHMVAPATNWYRWGRSDARPMPPAERAQRLERFLVPFDALRCQELLAS